MMQFSVFSMESEQSFCFLYLHLVLLPLKHLTNKQAECSCIDCSDKFYVCLEFSLCEKEANHWKKLQPNKPTN